MQIIKESKTIKVDEKKLAVLIDHLQGADQRIAHEAFMEIMQLRKREQELQNELTERKGQLKEVTTFLSNWTSGFESMIQNPVNLQNADQLQIRYQALRESAKNLVVSCRLKMEKIVLRSE